MQEILNRLKKHVLIPIIRTASFKEAETISQLLIETGITVLEVTMSVPEAYKLISELKTKHPDIIMGAGTLLNWEQAKNSIEAGAEFLVSPVTDEEIIKTGLKHNILTIPGTLTPTEITLAKKLGADAIKIFPISGCGGSSYLKAVSNIFPDTVFMPTGGINLKNLNDYLSANASLIGMGGNLANVQLLKEKKHKEIQDYAKEVLKIIKEYKESKQ